MKGKFLFIYLTIFHLGISPLFAQHDSLSYYTHLYYLTSNQSFQPHWQVSNRYGIFDRYEQHQFAGLFGLAYQRHLGRKFKINTEAEFNLRSSISNSYFQQLYFNLLYGSLQLKVGKEAYTLAQYSDDLGAGSLFLSNNTRPLPRIGIGFYNYTTVPFIDKFVEFKGAMNFGILNDDRSDFNGTDKPIFHEKFFYLRSKGLPVNLHIGLNHNAKMGGTLPNGTKLEMDLIATFFGKSGGAEETNVAGAHFGLYDFGLNWKIKDSNFQFYLQLPFSDGSGRKFQNKDKVLGILYNSRKQGFFANIIYEYINTIDQSGNGLPDPKVNGKLIFPYQIQDFDQFMLENFDTVTVGWTNKEFITYLEDEYNYGYKFNGRDDPYNNGMYPKGLSYHNENIGNSLFTNKSNMFAIDPDFNGVYDLYFVNNRIEAHHLAFDGFIGKNLSYRTKLTYSMNYGTYAGANKGRYNWGSMEDPKYYNSYYFKDGLKQAYTFFEVTFSPFKDKGANFSSSIAYDFGEMYHNFGILFGFHYNGFFPLKKDSKSQH